MKNTITQSFLAAVFLTLIGSVNVTVADDYPYPDYVLRWSTNGPNTNGWSNTSGYWVNPDNGVSLNNVSQFPGKVFYVQDKLPAAGTAVGYKEIRAYTDYYFRGAAFYLGLNTYRDNSGNIVSEFSTNQMRLGLGLNAAGTNEYTSEYAVTYNSNYFVDLTGVYLGHGIINSRLNEGTYRYDENTGTVNPDPSSAASGDVKIETYSVVGVKGTLNVLPDSNQDDIFRSVIGNNNKNRHMIFDSAFTAIVPEGAKLEFLSASWDNNEGHHPYSVLPIYGKIEGEGKIQFRALREDAILVYGNTEDFTGSVIIHTEDNLGSERFNNSYVIAGDARDVNTGISSSACEVIIETGNLIIQNDHTLNNLSSRYTITTTVDNIEVTVLSADKTRIAGSDKMYYNAFMPDEYHNDDHLNPKLTLHNTKATTYYGSICDAVETIEWKTTTGIDGKTYNYALQNYAFTGLISEVEKTGHETLNLYCAGSTGGICAESFVVSSGRINFNGVFQSAQDKAGLRVKAGAVFSPDSWGWGDDEAIAVGDDTVTINGDITIDAGGRIEFNFSDYNSLKHDVINIGDGFEFDTSISSIIDLRFMAKDPYAWATEDAEYLLIKGGGFPLEETDYSDLLINTYGNMQTLRQFGLLGKDGNLYLVTRYYVPEPSTWAMMILGAAGLLYWRRKNGRR